MEDEKRENYYSFNILLLGNSKVGKTSIINAYCKNIYIENNLSTIGFDHQFKEIIKGNKTITLKVWDTAGEERFKSLAKNVIKGADGILLVYDISDKKTFQAMEEWIDSIIEKVNLLEVPLIIIGNKYDLCIQNEKELKDDNIPKNEEKYEYEDNKNIFVTEELKKNFKNSIEKKIIEKYKNQNQNFDKIINLEIMEVSAKNNFNIEESFNKLVDEIIKINENNKGSKDKVIKSNTIKLKRNKKEKNKKKKFC